MSNGTNDFGVTYPQLLFMEKILGGHTNVSGFDRSNDIRFDIERTRGGECQLVCINEYTCGLGHVLNVLNVFPAVNIIYVGGNWNGYTLEAKEYCIEANLGLYNSSEINGALHRTDYWNYHRKDKDGNPEYEISRAG